MSPSPTLDSPNDAAAGAASAATAAATANTNLSQATTLPGTKVPALLPFNRSSSSSPSPQSEQDEDHILDEKDNEDDDEDNAMPGLFGNHTGEGDYTALHSC